jgi:hypothetical protein
MAEKKRNRFLLVAVLGLELALLALSVYTLYQLRDQGFNPVSTGQLVVLAGAMILIYLMYLKKETARAEDKVVGEKFRTGGLLEAMPVPAMMIDRDGTVLGANPRAAEVLGVDELELSVANVTETPGGELGAKLAAGGSGAFEARTGSGNELRCTATPIGGGGEGAARLVVLETAGAAGPAAGVACQEARNLVRQCAETVAPVLERSSDHLASLAAHARLSSPHEAGRAAQLAGVAVRLLQAGRRIRLAQQLDLITHGELKGSLHVESFDGVAAVAETFEKTKALFAATGVELASELPDGAVQVNADRDRVILALRDLMEVCLAMTAAGDKVTVAVLPGEGEAEITVTDTGLGMSPEELDSLFSTSGSPPVHDDYTGGIRDGLFVAKEIMEACGGQLWAESAPGRGTRFNMRVPVA